LVGEIAFFEADEERISLSRVRGDIQEMISKVKIDSSKAQGM